MEHCSLRSWSLYAGSVVARAAATLLVVSVLVFLAIHLIPGGFEKLYLGQLGTEEQARAIREQLGLDRTLPEQYLRWISGILTGNLGLSLLSNRPITDQLAVRLPATVQLAVLATLISV